MITIKITQKTLDDIILKYQNFITDRDIGYILYVIKADDNIFTIYSNKKGNYYKMTIQGQDPMSVAKLYSMDEKIMPKKQKITKESPYFIDVDQQIGSDEVGTGDFLAPIVVCAVYVDHETMKLIQQYNITDSKKLTDEKILQIVPLLIKKVHYVAKILENDRYNNAYEKGFNINKIKATLHNYCLFELHKKCPYVENVYMDQFVNGETYYSYLSYTSKVEKNIIFKEKGETYFPSVALASCIARYLFLENMSFKESKLGQKIPLGAGKNTIDFGVEFIKKYGKDEFKKLAKLNFTNYNEILKLI